VSGGEPRASARYLPPERIRETIPHSAQPRAACRSSRRPRCRIK